MPVIGAASVQALPRDLSDDYEEDSGPINLNNHFDLGFGGGAGQQVLEQVTTSWLDLLARFRRYKTFTACLAWIFCSAAIIDNLLLPQKDSIGIMSVEDTLQVCFQEHNCTSHFTSLWLKCLDIIV